MVAPSTWSRRTVGRFSSTWSAKPGHLITSTDETRESIMMDVLVELSIEMALAFPLTRMVVFLHLVIRIDWFLSTSISTVAEGESKFSCFSK
jgi:hypothetical protein